MVIQNIRLMERKEAAPAITAGSKTKMGKIVAVCISPNKGERKRM